MHCGPGRNIESCVRLWDDDQFHEWQYDIFEMMITSVVEEWPAWGQNRWPTQWHLLTPICLSCHFVHYSDCTWMLWLTPWHLLIHICVSRHFEQHSDRTWMFFSGTQLMLVKTNMHLCILVFSFKEKHAGEHVIMMADHVPDYLNIIHTSQYTKGKRILLIQKQLEWMPNML